VDLLVNSWTEKSTWRLTQSHEMLKVRFLKSHSYSNHDLCTIRSWECCCCWDVHKRKQSLICDETTKKEMKNVFLEFKSSSLQSQRHLLTNTNVYLRKKRTSWLIDKRIVHNLMQSQIAFPEASVIVSAATSCSNKRGSRHVPIKHDCWKE
jgi:hypothetical protein